MELMKSLPLLRDVFAKRVALRRLRTRKYGKDSWGWRRNFRLSYRKNTKHLRFQIGVSKDVTHRVLKEQLLHQYHIQSIHLLPLDPYKRLSFCGIINYQRAHNMNICRNILFIDETCITRSYTTNLHDRHVWADENPHSIKVTHYQH